MVPRETMNNKSQQNCSPDEVWLKAALYTMYFYFPSIVIVIQENIFISIFCFTVVTFLMVFFWVKNIIMYNMMIKTRFMNVWFILSLISISFFSLFIILFYIYTDIDSASFDFLLLIMVINSLISYATLVAYAYRKASIENISIWKTMGY